MKEYVCRKQLKRLAVFVLFVIFFGTASLVNRAGLSASLTSVSVTLSNPRPSFKGALSSGNSVGSTLVRINTTQGAYPSTSAAQLVEGDWLKIGTAGSMGSYRVTDSKTDSDFTVNTPLSSATAGYDVIASQSSDLTVRFTTANAVSNGSFRVLVPAESTDSVASDGIPDPGKFDLGNSQTLGDHGDWVLVPGNPTYGTSDFYVMKYEAKYDCTGDGDGDTAAACSATADSGAGLDWRDVSQTSANVVSTANGAPIVHITQTQALTACPTGTHLITNNEWMTIARNVEQVGTNWTGGSVGSGCLFRGNSGETTCGYNSGTDPDYGTSRNARAKFTLSNGSEVYDMSGNVWDWNSDTIMGANKPVGNTGAWVEWTTVSNFGTLSYDLTRPSNTSWNSTQGIGQYYEGSSSGGPYAFRRGAYWINTSVAGVFALYLSSAPSLQSGDIGFRCASDPVALSPSNTSFPKVSCPSDTTGYTFGSPTVGVSSVTLGGQDYHAFTCPYTGAGAIGTVFDGQSNDAMEIGGMVNPAPVSGHSLGTADRSTVIVQHLDNSNNVVDSTATNVGLIEAVKVTASVAPLISFRIIGVNSGLTACGVTTSVATTPTLVPFGDVLIDSFTYAAQTLAVSTNAADGYSVTAVENDQLGRDGGVCSGDPDISTNASCIQDSRGDDAAMTHTNPDDWSSTSTKGFGYSLDNSNSVADLTPAFEYDSTTGSCGGGGDCYRQFADAENSQSPVTLFSADQPADNHNLFMCYKMIIPTIQAAGNYENYVTYTATATF